MDSNWFKSVAKWLRRTDSPANAREQKGLLREDQVKDILERTLALLPTEHGEVFLQASNEALTRFANNGIHQNVAEQDTTLTVRAVHGRKVGIAETNDLRPDSLKWVAQRAAEVARSLPDNPEFLELVRPTAISQCPRVYFPETAKCQPTERAEGVRIFIERTGRSNLIAAGSFATAEVELGIVNTMGVDVYQALTESHFQAVAMDDTSSGYTDAAARNMAEIKPAELAEEAVQKCLDSRNPRDIDAGTYPVILEEHAVGTLMEFLAYIGLNARAYQEGRSCLCDKLGQRVATDLITLWDDGLDPRSLPVAFDYEGTAKEKILFIDRGTATGLAYDSFTANKEGRMSTGHALPASQQSWGPVPMHLFLQPGTSPVDGMIASLERGLYITRFHYTNVVEERGSIITGMTRDGTWWIEDGKIAYPVKNLRFTQSILESLLAVRMVSNRTRRLGNGSVMPLLLLDRFHFSSKTTF